MHTYTMDEMVKRVARAALREHSPRDYLTETLDIFDQVSLKDHLAARQWRRHEENSTRWTPTLLPLAAVIASAVVKGTSREWDTNYHHYQNGFLVEVTYAKQGWMAGYEVGPCDQRPVIWYN